VNDVISQEEASLTPTPAKTALKRKATEVEEVCDGDKRYQRDSSIVFGPVRVTAVFRKFSNLNRDIRMLRWTKLNVATRSSHQSRRQVVPSTLFIPSYRYGSGTLKP
jgi:hypothetical protein